MNDIDESNKYILCLDVSLSCTGYSVFENNKIIECGIIDTTKIKCRNDECYGEKLLIIFNKLKELEHNYSFNTILIERSFVQFAKATKAIQKTLGIIELLFNKKEIILYSPKTTKKFMLSGDANKEDMIDSVNFMYGLNLSKIKKDKQDNIADSIALGAYYFASK